MGHYMAPIGPHTGPYIAPYTRPYFGPSFPFVSCPIFPLWALACGGIGAANHSNSNATSAATTKAATTAAATSGALGYVVALHRSEQLCSEQRSETYSEIGPYRASWGPK